MSITSMLFLFVFLPLSLAIYYMVGDNVKEYVLLGISLLFYAIGVVEYMPLFIVSVFLAVALGRGIHACPNTGLRKFLLILGILYNAGALFYFKYFDFVLMSVGLLSEESTGADTLLLPLGISFYSFKAISYLADVYTGKAQLDPDPFHDALYLSFFAQIQSGPITRYEDTRRQGNERADLFAQGVIRFLIGFFKKVLIANVLANITNEIFGAPVESYSTLYAWVGAVCFSLQLFFDFAGYSDMAIGISAMFGYRCMENFDYPYMTPSVSGFWRRWHISLSRWFRDYIYIPMGGSRTKTKGRTYLNLLVVWLLTGIWHGADFNFIAWGLGYFVVIAFEKLTGLPDRFKTLFGRGIYRVLTLLFINFQWVLFHSQGIRAGLRYIKRMVIYQGNELADLRALFLLKDYWFFLLMAVIFSFPVAPRLEQKAAGNPILSVVWEVIKYVGILLAFAWAVSFVVAGQNNPFAYANF